MTGRKRIRVLYFYPYSNFDTGSPKAMAQMVASLDRSIFEPVYCATEDGPLVEAMGALGVEIVRGAVGPISLRRPIDAVRRIRRQAERLKEWRINLLHANGLFWNCELTLGARAAGIPAIAHVHNPTDVAFHNLVRFAVDRVLFCSAFEMRNCGHVERLAGRTQVFHNFIDVNRFAHGRSLRGELGIARDALVVGTVAQVVQRKGIDILLETARCLLKERPNLVFLIAGPQSKAEAEFGRRMYSLAAAPEFGGAVRFLGPRADIPDLLATLDLFVFPTRSEPMGIAVLEAMAAGAPVIASNVGGIPEIIASPEIGRLVDPISTEAFSNAIRAALNEPDRSRAMALRGQSSVRERFDVAHGGNRLKQIYTSVLERRTRRDRPVAVEARRSAAAQRQS